MAAKSAKSVTAMASDKEVANLASAWKPAVHLHGAPRCMNGKHNQSCNGKGTEIVCAQVTVFGKKFAVCVHV